MECDTEEEGETRYKIIQTRIFLILMVCISSAYLLKKNLIIYFLLFLGGVWTWWLESTVYLGAGFIHFFLNPFFFLMIRKDCWVSTDGKTICIVSHNQEHMMRKNQQQELMIWQHLSTGGRPHSQISLYRHTLYFCFKISILLCNLIRQCVNTSHKSQV